MKILNDLSQLNELTGLRGWDRSRLMCAGLAMAATLFFSVMAEAAEPESPATVPWANRHPRRPRLNPWPIQTSS